MTATSTTSTPTEVPKPYSPWWHPHKTWGDSIMSSCLLPMIMPLHNLASTSTTTASPQLTSMRAMGGESQMAQSALAKMVQAWETIAGDDIVERDYAIPRPNAEAVLRDKYGFPDEMLHDQDLLSRIDETLPTTPVAVKLFFPKELLLLGHYNSQEWVKSSRGLLVAANNGNNCAEESEVRQLVQVANQQTIPVVLFFHGGGMVFGDAYSQSIEYVVDVLQQTPQEPHRPILAIGVDYSHAPEHPFPVAVLETLTVVSHLLDECGLQQVHMAGNSAGSNLATVAVMEGHRRFPGRIRSAMIRCPFLNPAADTMSYHLNSKERFVTAGFIRWCLKSYLQFPNEDDSQINNNVEEDHQTPLERALARGSNQTLWKNSPWNTAPWNRLVHPTVDLPTMDDPATCPHVIVVTNRGDVLCDDGIQLVEALRANHQAAANVTHFDHRGTHSLGTDMFDPQGKKEVMQAWAKVLWET